MDQKLILSVAAIAHDAGTRLEAMFDANARPADHDALFDRMRRNEESVMFLRDSLASVRPQARWLPSEYEAAALPNGEWWVVDPVEGNVNHAHGIADWCVTITLVRDGDPVLTVVRQPIGDHTYTAVRGEGAELDGVRLSVAAKSNLADAIVATGQAEHGQFETHDLIARSIRTMLDHSLLVGASVPSTFPMLAVAAGHVDVFWQYRPTLPGIAAGVLLATEAGGVVSRIDGQGWSPGSPDILVTNQALRPIATAALS